MPTHLSHNTDAVMDVRSSNSEGEESQHGQFESTKTLGPNCEEGEQDEREEHEVEGLCAGFRHLTDYQSAGNVGKDSARQPEVEARVEVDDVGGRIEGPPDGDRKKEQSGEQRQQGFIPTLLLKLVALLALDNVIE